MFQRTKQEETVIESNTRNYAFQEKVGYIILIKSVLFQKEFPILEFLNNFSSVPNTCSIFRSFEPKMTTRNATKYLLDETSFLKSNGR